MSRATFRPVQSSQTSRSLGPQQFHSRDNRPSSRWPEPTRRSLQFTARSAIVAYVVSLFVTNAIAIAAYQIFGWNIPVGIGVVIVDITLLGTLVPLYRAMPFRPRDLGLRPAPSARSVGWTLLAAAAFTAFALLWRHVSPQTPNNALASELSHLNGIVLTISAVSLTLCAPAVEEIFYRGFVYRALRNRLPLLPAVVVAAAMFALVHAGGHPSSALLSAAFFGVVACLLYERTGSLLPAISLHIFNDAGAFEFSLTGNSKIVVLSFLTLVVVIIVWPLLRSLLRLRG
jgi:membrane protease YdiL (CAAX protease family)